MFVTALLLAVTTLPAAGTQRADPGRHAIDFHAVAADGSVVTDLRAEDVTVKVNGRTRPVRSLRLIHQADSPADESLVAGPPPPFGTNRVAEGGRSFIVVIDDESFRPGRELPIRAALRRLLGVLASRDRVSLWTVPHGGIKVNFTTDHDRVSAALDLVSGQGPQQEPGSDAACRTRTTLYELAHMLEALVGGEGPTTVLLFTASLFGPRRDNPPNRAPGPCELRLEDFLRVGHAAARARAQFYIVQPEDLQRLPTTAADTLAGVGFAATLNPLEGIEHLAGVTGATRTSLSRQGDATLLSVARATAAYYTVVVDAAGSDVVGTHALEISSARPGVDIRARPFLYVDRPAGASPSWQTPAALLAERATVGDLPLRIEGFTSMDPSGGIRLVAVAEPEDADTVLTGAMIGVVDQNGKFAGRIDLAASLTARPLMASVVVPPGYYRVRVAALDSLGRAGSADTDVLADTTPAGPLRLSSLVLGLGRDDAFQPRLQFSDEPAALAYLDFEGGEPGAPVTAYLEISRTLNGPPLATTRLVIGPTSRPSRFTATGAVAIGALPPGDYVVRAIVGVDGQPAGRVIRTLRKVGR